MVVHMVLLAVLAAGMAACLSFVATSALSIWLEGKLRGMRVLKYSVSLASDQVLAAIRLPLALAALAVSTALAHALVPSNPITAMLLLDASSCRVAATCQSSSMGGAGVGPSQEGAPTAASEVSPADLPLSTLPSLPASIVHSTLCNIVHPVPPASPRPPSVGSLWDCGIVAGLAAVVWVIWLAAHHRSITSIARQGRWGYVKWSLMAGGATALHAVFVQGGLVAWGPPLQVLARLALAAATRVALLQCAVVALPLSAFVVFAFLAPAVGLEIATQVSRDPSLPARLVWRRPRSPPPAYSAQATSAMFTCILTCWLHIVWAVVGAWGGILARAADSTLAADQSIRVAGATQPMGSDIQAITDLCFQGALLLLALSLAAWVVALAHDFLGLLTTKLPLVAGGLNAHFLAPANPAAAAPNTPAPSRQVHRAGFPPLPLEDLATTLPFVKAVRHCMGVAAELITGGKTAAEGAALQPQQLRILLPPAISQTVDVVGQLVRGDPLWSRVLQGLLELPAAAGEMAAHVADNLPQPAEDGSRARVVAYLWSLEWLTGGPLLGRLLGMAHDALELVNAVFSRAQILNTIATNAFDQRSLRAGAIIGPVSMQATSWGGVDLTHVFVEVTALSRTTTLGMLPAPAALAGSHPIAVVRLLAAPTAEDADEPHVYGALPLVIPPGQEYKGSLLVDVAVSQTHLLAALAGVDSVSRGALQSHVHSALRTAAAAMGIPLPPTGNRPTGGPIPSVLQLAYTASLQRTLAQRRLLERSPPTRWAIDAAAAFNLQEYADIGLNGQLATLMREEQVPRGFMPRGRRQAWGAARDLVPWLQPTFERLSGVHQVLGLLSQFVREERGRRGAAEEVGGPPPLPRVEAAPQVLGLTRTFSDAVQDIVSPLAAQQSVQVSTGWYHCLHWAGTLRRGSSAPLFPMGLTGSSALGPRVAPSPPRRRRSSSFTPDEPEEADPYEDVPWFVGVPLSAWHEVARWAAWLLSLGDPAPLIVPLPDTTPITGLGTLDTLLPHSQNTLDLHAPLQSWGLSPFDAVMGPGLHPTLPATHDLYTLDLSLEAGSFNIESGHSQACTDDPSNPWEPVSTREGAYPEETRRREPAQAGDMASDAKQWGQYTIGTQLAETAAGCTTDASADASPAGVFEVSQVATEVWGAPAVRVTRSAATAHAAEPGRRGTLSETGAVSSAPVPVQHFTCRLVCWQWQWAGRLCACCGLQTLGESVDQVLGSFLRTTVGAPSDRDTAAPGAFWPNLAGVTRGTPVQATLVLAQGDVVVSLPLAQSLCQGGQFAPWTGVLPSFASEVLQTARRQNDGREPLLLPSSVDDVVEAMTDWMASTGPREATSRYLTRLEMWRRGEVWCKSILPALEARGDLSEGVTSCLASITRFERLATARTLQRLRVPEGSLGGAFHAPPSLGAPHSPARSLSSAGSDSGSVVSTDSIADIPFDLEAVGFTRQASAASTSSRASASSTAWRQELRGGGGGTWGGRAQGTAAAHAPPEGVWGRVVELANILAWLGAQAATTAVPVLTAANSEMLLELCDASAHLGNLQDAEAGVAPGPPAYPPPQTVAGDFSLMGMVQWLGDWVAAIVASPAGGLQWSRTNPVTACALQEVIVRVANAYCSLLAAQGVWEGHGTDGSLPAVLLLPAEEGEEGGIPGGGEETLAASLEAWHRAHGVYSREGFPTLPTVVRVQAALLLIAGWGKFVASAAAPPPPAGAAQGR